MSYDSIVIGGGSGGLAYATKAAELGARVLMVERDRLGGTCVNRGCVPKKILWSAGHLARAAQAAEAAGLGTAPQLDMAALGRRRDDHIANLNQTFETELAEAGVTLLRGAAKVDGTAVMVDGARHEAQRIVLAVGARPAALDIPGSEHLSTSQDVLSWTSLPRSAVIVGGGYIGCEFAAILTALGTRVTLVHDGARLLDTFPEPLARHVTQQLTEAGITLHLDDTLAEVTQGAALRWTLEGGTKGEADAVVAAVGRTPNIDTLGPLADRLATAKTGALAVDAQLQTNVPGVHALGDVADRLPLTPVATADGTALAHILHGEGATLPDLDLVATTTFVYPPAAFVGEVAEESGPADTFRPLSDHVLGTASGPEPDLYRIGFDPATGALTGAQIVAEGAENMIALLAALKAGGGRAGFEQATAVHPSFAEEFFIN